MNIFLKIFLFLVSFIVLVYLSAIIFPLGPTAGLLVNFFAKNQTNQYVAPPTSEWIAYSNADLKFSVKYPPDWVYRKSAESNANNLIALVFSPKDSSSKVDSVVLRVLPKNNQVSIQDWFNQYTSSSSQSDNNNASNYVLFDVREIQQSIIGKLQVMNYITNASGSLKGAGTALIFGDNVFAFLTMEGRSEQIKSEMINSLSSM